MVAEVDESDGTIDLFNPEITVLLNVDWDHTDRYTEKEQMFATFRGLLERTKSQVILPAVDPGMKSISHGIDAKVDSFSVEEESGHRAYNRAAALALLQSMPEGERVGADCFDGFPGMARRLSLLHESASLRVFEDYAHHPTEIDSLLSDLRMSEGKNRLVVVFSRIAILVPGSLRMSLQRRCGRRIPVFFCLFTPRMKMVWWAGNWRI